MDSFSPFLAILVPIPPSMPDLVSHDLNCQLNDQRISWSSTETNAFAPHLSLDVNRLAGSIDR